MKKAEALAHLKRQISEIDLVSSAGRNSPEFTKWQRDTQITLENIFGTDHANAVEFSNIGFSLTVFSSRTTEADRGRKFQSSLVIAKATLDSMVTEIQRFWAGDTDQNQVHIEKANALSASDVVKENVVDASEIRAVLFMDISGWSKLSSVDIKRYVQVALPRLKGCLGEPDFHNTWGDAIVATYRSSVDAAKAALEVRDFFQRTTAEGGVADGLTCRVALHQGEILLLQNALTGKMDIFGHAIHLAARLEPATAPGHVFCTAAFASALKGVAGHGPKAWPLGPVKLPKDHGIEQVSVVTHANVQEDPAPALQKYVHSSAPGGGTIP